jgi:hypothetical protein
MSSNTRHTDLSHHGNKLGHLHHRDVPLDKVHAAESDGSAEIVAVHNHVDKRVEHGAVPGFASRSEEGDEPPDEEDGGVVVDVEERHLVVVSLEHHDDGVDELG